MSLLPDQDEDYRWWIWWWLPSGMSCHAVWYTGTIVSEKQWQLAPRLHGVKQLKTVFFNTMRFYKPI